MVLHTHKSGDGLNMDLLYAKVLLWKLERVLPWKNLKQRQMKIGVAVAPVAWVNKAGKFSLLQKYWNYIIPSDVVTVWNDDLSRICRSICKWFMIQCSQVSSIA